MTKAQFTDLAKKHGVIPHYCGKTKTFYLEGDSKIVSTFMEVFSKNVRDSLLDKKLLDVSQNFAVSNSYRINSHERGRQMQRIRRIGRKEHREQKVQEEDI